MKIQRKFVFPFPPEQIQRLRLRFVDDFRQAPNEFEEHDLQGVVRDDYWIERFLSGHDGKLGISKQI